MKRAASMAAFALAQAPVLAAAHETQAGGGAAAILGRLHMALVHFPVALILMAAVAELLCITRRDGRYSDVARFMITAGAWISIPAAATGFFRADTITMNDAEQSLFAIHRVAGIATPVLVFLCAGLAEGVRRSGQIWELFLFRAVLLLAAVSAAVAGYVGGEIVFGIFPLW
ncbi:MAG TPA: DUF2231 domain-containing protein [Candidatus Krumholzibacteria bacterium]